MDKTMNISLETRLDKEDFNDKLFTKTCLLLSSELPEYFMENFTLFITNNVASTVNQNEKGSTKEYDTKRGSGLVAAVVIETQGDMDLL